MTRGAAGRTLQFAGTFESTTTFGPMRALFPTTREPMIRAPGAMLTLSSSVG